MVYLDGMWTNGQGSLENMTNNHNLIDLYLKHNEIQKNSRNNASESESSAQVFCKHVSQRSWVPLTFVYENETPESSFNFSQKKYFQAFHALQPYKCYEKGEMARNL